MHHLVSLLTLKYILNTLKLFSSTISCGCFSSNISDDIFTWTQVWTLCTFHHTVYEDLKLLMTKLDVLNVLLSLGRSIQSWYIDASVWWMIALLHTVCVFMHTARYVCMTYLELYQTSSRKQIGVCLQPSPLPGAPHTVWCERCCSLVALIAVMRPGVGPLYTTPTGRLTRSPHSFYTASRVHVSSQITSFTRFILEKQNDDDGADVATVEGPLIRCSLRCCLNSLTGSCLEKKKSLEKRIALCEK